jgi:hypothetical protein
MAEQYYNHVSHRMLLQTTKALAKFVREHQGVQLSVLNEIVAALESGDFRRAAKTFKTIHFGAWGFTDWFPPVAFANEDADFVQVVFESLVERWYRLMNTAIG